MVIFNRLKAAHHQPYEFVADAEFRAHPLAYERIGTEALGIDAVGNQA